MVLGYSLNYPWGGETHFVRKIVRREKIHSIRTDKKNRWKAGRSIQQVTGNRTKNRNQFASETCDGVQTVSISFNTDGTINLVLVDSVQIKDWHKIAINDGLTASDFQAWFFLNAEQYVYEGKIIHWTPLRY